MNYIWKIFSKLRKLSKTFRKIKLFQETSMATKNQKKTHFKNYKD